MVFLITSFFVISPIVVLYTMGFRYDVKTGAVRSTGVISVDIDPNDARVYVNDIVIEQGMPIRLTNRAPGSYDIRIERGGYKTWEKDIIVWSNQTSYVTGFELIKDETPLAVSLPEHTHVATIGYTANKKIGLLYGKSSSTTGITLGLFDPITQTTSELDTFNGGMLFDTSPFTPVLFAAEIGESERTIHIIDTTNPSRRTKQSIKKEVDRDFEHQWSKRDGEVYIRTTDTIERMSVRGDRRVVATIPVSSTLWYVEQGEKVWMADGNTLFRKDDPSNAYNIPDAAVKIIDINDHRIILHSPNGIIVVKRNVTENAVTHTGAHLPHFDATKNEWLIWSDWELSSIDNDGNVYLLGREGKKILSAQPFDELGLRVVLHENGISTLNTNMFPSQTLVERKDIHWMVTFPEERLLYYTFYKNGELVLDRLVY